MNDLTHPRTLIDRPRLDAVIAPIVRAHGGEIVDVEWKQEPGGWVLRVFVEKLGSAEARATTADGAVSLDLCTAVARDLSPALDVADIIPHRYSLEVSSPGLERPLRDARDYSRFVGQKAKVRVREPVDGQKVIVGVIEPADTGADACIALRDGSRTYTIPLDIVSSGRLVFEFGPAPRPGKPGKTAKVGREPHPPTRPSNAGAHGAPPDPKETSNS
jgi:ribosome maturation factor RimP